MFLFWSKIPIQRHTNICAIFYIIDNFSWWLKIQIVAGTIFPLHFHYRILVIYIHKFILGFLWYIMNIYPLTTHTSLELISFVWAQEGFTKQLTCVLWKSFEIYYLEHSDWSHSLPQKVDLWSVWVKIHMNYQPCSKD